MAKATEELHEDFWGNQEQDYYALLGVRRDASLEQIRSRYMALSREFHPDRNRNRDPALTALANTQYPILDRAYKVLSDPIRRQAYDAYGEMGLLAVDEDEELSNAICVQYKSSAEVRKQVEAVLRRMGENALEAQFHSMSEMSIHVDATDFFAEPMRGLRSLFDRGNRFIDRTQMSIHQSTTLPLSTNSNLTLGGYMFDKQGLGLGAFTCQYEYSSPDPSIPSFALSSELGWTPKINCQITQPVSQYTAFTLIPELDDNGLEMSVGVNQVLAPNLQGGMVYSTRNGLQATLNTDTQVYRASAAVAVRNDGPSISAQYRRHLTTATTGKIAIEGGLLSGLSMSFGGSTAWSERTRTGMGVLLAKTGVSLRIAFTRGSVRFVIPILVSPFSAESAWSTFWAATSPFIVSAIVSQLIKPAQERKRKRRMDAVIQLRDNFLHNAKHSAIAQQKLMKRCAKEKRQAEEDKNGLVILVARYGRNPSSAMENSSFLRHINGEETYDSNESDEAFEYNVDVTIPLQFFVNESSLYLNDSSKAGLLGFYNPCMRDFDPADFSGNKSRKPLLYIRYTMDSQVFEATFEDEQEVVLPSRYARLMGSSGKVY